MALPPSLNVEQALLDYDEQEEKKKSSVKIFGKSISDIPCFRDAFLYGILGGFGVGLTTFMFTSRGKRSVDFGFASYLLITMGTFGYCRYNRAVQKWEIQLIKSSLLNAGVTTAADPSPSTNPEDVAIISPAKKPKHV